MTSIRALPYADFLSAIERIDEPRYKSEIIAAFLYKHGAAAWSEMTSLSLASREALADRYSLAPPRVASRAVARDGTVKALFDWDGTIAEAVFMPSVKGRTLCLSVQSGCRLDCAFCATAKLGLRKNLAFGQILDQILYFSGEGAVSRIVFMGMGEPMDNLDEVVPALKFITSEKGLGFSRRRVTVSTVGVCDKIRSFAGDSSGVNLAISLHATEDSKRAELVPIAKKFPIKELLETAADYGKRAKAKVTIEYLLLDGVNDTDDDAKRLARFSSRHDMPVNIICFNPVAGIVFSPSRRLDPFVTLLAKSAFAVTVRRSKGLDISAACGQLAGESLAGASA